MLIKTRIKEGELSILEGISIGARRHSKLWLHHNVSENEHNTMKADKRLEVEKVEEKPKPAPVEKPAKKVTKTYKPDPTKIKV